MNKTDWELYNQIMAATAYIDDEERVKRIANQAARNHSIAQAGIIKSRYSDLMYEVDKQKKLNASFGTWREWLVVAGIIALIVLV